MSKITNKEGFEWLENEIMGLKPRTKLFNLLKAHLIQHGYWKNKPRRDAKKGYLTRMSNSSSADDNNYQISR